MSRRRWVGRWLGFFALLGLALLGAACSNGAAPGTTTTSVPSTTSTTTTTVVAPTSTTSASTTSTTAARPSPCRGSQLAVAKNGSSGAVGSIDVGFAVSNTGSKPCTIFGYPGLVLWDGSKSDAVFSHDGQGPAFRAGLQSLVVGAGAAVGFVFEYSDVQTNGCQLANYNKLTVTLPAAAAESVSVKLQVQSCSASVSPLVSASVEKSQFS